MTTKTYDPRNSNPFDTDDTIDFKSEYVANIELKKTILDISTTRIPDDVTWRDLNDPHFELI
jgi:hypothetical protein